MNEFIYIPPKKLDTKPIDNVEQDDKLLAPDSLVTTSTARIQHHTIQKRNTNKHDVAAQTKLVRVIAKSQSQTNSETIIPTISNSSDTKEQKNNSLPLPTSTSSFYLEPFQYTVARSPSGSFIQTNTSNKRLSESLIKWVDSKLANLTMLTANANSNSTSFTLAKPSDYLNCERNLTKLTVFYSNSDKLTCFEILTNNSLLRCIDDLLETKLVVKLSLFYHVQLQPLFIYKSKMMCSYRNGTLLKWSQAKLQQQSSQSYHHHRRMSTSVTTRSSSRLPVQHYSAEGSSEEDLNRAKTSSTYNSTLIKLKNVIGHKTNNHKTAEEEYTEGESYLSAFDPRESLSCTLITKKSTNRKKLIWKLFLILKNQTCIPLLNEPSVPLLPIASMPLPPLSLPPQSSLPSSYPPLSPQQPNNKTKPVGGKSAANGGTFDSNLGSKNLSRVKTLTSDETRSLADDEVVKCILFFSTLLLNFKHGVKRK